MRGHLPVCGSVIILAAIAAAVLLAHIVAGVITDPSTRTLRQWAPALSITVGAVGRFARRHSGCRLG